MTGLRTRKELQKNLRSRIKKLNVKKQLKYSLEYKEYRDVLAECLN
jgi:hypothetical protein